MPELLLAVDVGGTFTDAYLHGPDGWSRAKAPTTPADRTRGVVDAAEGVLAQADVEPGSIERVLHGTTAATNALLEGDWARTALVTNEAFEDVVEIGRQTRPALYELDQTPPDPIVPRDRRFGIQARLDADGEERRPVDGSEVDAIADRLAGLDVDAVAVGLLHAHRSSRHEDRVAALLRDRLEARVVTSSATSPEPREVERLTTTIVNAALAPRISRYLDRLEERLAQAGLQAPVRVLDSAAATVTPAEAAELPVRAVLSGPAGGAAANRHLAETTQTPTLVGVDMGGTSTDVSLVQGGQPTTRWSVEVAGRGLQIPAVDVHTVGAGGGSIAWRDEADGLRVGPASAGADPGPACYGRGGTQPTVTDANLLLDRIPPSAALAGDLQLDADAARAAIERISEADPRATARSILEIAVARTVRGLRSLTARHAVDPDRAALAAFGGAGPQFGAAWARRLGIPRVLVPAAAGVTSAKGLLAAPPRVERSQGLLVPADELTAKRYDEHATRLTEAARERLPDVEEPAIVHRVSARYEGQSHELTVEVPGQDPARIPEAFEARHEDQHGYRLDEPVEVVALRVEARGLAPLTAHAGPTPDAQPAPEPVETVEAAFVDHDGAHETPVLREQDLTPGVELAGPAIVASPDTTILVSPDAEGQVHGSGALILEMEGST